MTEPENASKARKPPHRWRKRVACALVLGTALLAIFHRPILIAAIHTAAVRWAAREKLRIDLEVEGSVFTGITLRNLRAVPIGLSPVDSITIESLRVHYDLPRLFRRGIRDFVTAYRLRNASLVLSPSRGTTQQKEEIAKTLRDILQQPALFSDRVQVENFNLTVNTEHGPLVIGGASALLDPISPGFIQFGEVTIPRIATWRNIRAAASFIDRHLIARDFQLGNDLHAVRLELNASQRAKSMNFLSFEGTVLGGDVGLFLWRHEIDRHTSEAQLTAYVGNLSLKALHDFSRWKPPVTGTVTQAWLQLAGNPNIPSQWNGNCTVEGRAVTIAGFNLDRVMADLRIANGVVRLHRGEVATAGNRVEFQIERPLPNTVDELIASGFVARFSAKAPDISKIHPVLNGITGGTANGSGEFRIDENLFTVTLSSTVSALAGAGVPEGPFSVESGTAFARYTHRFQDPPHTPWFFGTDATLEASAKTLRAGPSVFDTATAVAGIHEGKMDVSFAEFRRGPNAIRLNASCTLPPAGRSRLWRNAEYGVRFSVAAPELAAFAATPGLALSGSLAASGELRHRADGFSGHGKAEGSDLVFHEFAAKRLELEIPVEKSHARGISLFLDINGKDRLTGEGSVDLRPPFGYEARLSGKVRDLSIFQPLIRTPLAGALDVDWHGSGELRAMRHTGEGQIAITHGRVADFTRIDGEIAGRYSPESIDLGPFHLQSDQGSVQAAVRLRDQRLQVDRLRLEVAKLGLVTGNLSLPVDLRTPTQPETVFPAAGALQGALTLEALDLAKIVPSKSSIVVQKRVSHHRGGKPEPVGSMPPASSPPVDTGLRGQISGSLTLGGTFGAPELSAVFKARDLQAAAAKKLPPSSAALTVTVRNDRLVANGALFQPGISPLQVTGAMPLVLKQVIAERRIDPETPISVTVKLPASPASLLTLITPAIRYTEGRMSIDATCAGTFEHPVLDGGIALDLPAIRFQSADAPGVGNLRGNLRFSGNELVVRQLQGDVAGGPFAVAGRVNLEHLTAPQLDLRFRSEGTLLVRNDSLTLRADSDLKISGPFDAARVTGNVGIAKSRFYRDIEILPIGLPGNPAPKPAQTRFAPSIETPPFRDWSFDVAIKTTEPFVIRSNLASGQAYADLRLGGNGLAPTLEGAARVENFVASLPFSRLTVDYGHLYFSADAPFDPTLDIHGTSRIRDYNIGAYIYGTASEPQTLFTSEPPLAQEEVIALLATGATSKEFTENHQVLAGRAGVLLLQDLYHKVFKKRNPPPDAKPEQPLDRFSLDVGTVDPRTGRQEINGRFKFSDQYEIGAGVDVQGDVQVQLRYLLRFR